MNKIYIKFTVTPVISVIREAISVIRNAKRQKHFYLNPKPFRLVSASIGFVSTNPLVRETLKPLRRNGGVLL